MAKQLFPLVGASGATALRLVIGALMLFCVFRPWRMRPTRNEMRAILIYGVAMGAMNFLFYHALDTIPLGIAVALEFTGPLAVAMASSRRVLDFLWIALAVLGLMALLPLGGDAARLDPLGIVLALLAGVCWAIYIVFGQKSGTSHAGQTAAWGTLAGAIVICPIGIAHSGLALFAPAALPFACGVALLSSALPYSLEMVALRSLPARTFGILMSMEPAVGALAGRLLLGEALHPIQWVAIACIMLASAGSAATSGSALADQ